MNTAQLQQYADRAARRYGVSPSIFRRQIGAESGWNPNAHSGAGANGIAQFIESTARRYHVNTHDGDPRDDLMGAARMMSDLLRQTGGNYKKALSMYNSGRPDGYQRFAETRGYVQKILGGSNPTGATSAGGGASDPGGMKLQMGTEQTDVQDPELQRKQFFAEWFAKRNPDSPLVKLGVVDPAMATTRAVDIPMVTGFKMTGGGSSPAAPSRGRGGKVSFAPNANRKGVGISPTLMRGLDYLSGYIGSIRVGTGTNHNRMTTSGNVSDHWDGHGADIPMTGNKLTQSGRRALVAFGMDPAEARKAAGGIYNLQWKGHRVQVIFNTTEGGNHWNHLHVGIR